MTESSLLGGSLRVILGTFGGGGWLHAVQDDLDMTRHYWLNDDPRSIQVRQKIKIILAWLDSLQEQATGCDKQAGETPRVDIKDLQLPRNRSVAYLRCSRMLECWWFDHPVATVGLALETFPLSILHKPTLEERGTFTSFEIFDQFQYVLDSLLS